MIIKVLRVACPVVFLVYWTTLLDGRWIAAIPLIIISKEIQTKKPLAIINEMVSNVILLIL